MNFKNLHKEKWEKVHISEVATDSIKKVKPTETEYDVFIRPEDLGVGDLYIKGQREISTAKSGQIFKIGDTLFARRSVSITQFKKRAAIATFNGVCSDEITVSRPKNDKITNKYLSLLLNSEKVWDFGLAVAVGSVSKRIKWKDLANFQFLLPPLPEQKLISSILYKIEATIEQTEKQEKALVEYRKGMVNTIFNHNENFGTLLPKKKKKLELFGNVAKNIQKSEKNPLENGLERFVGLEHIIPENLNITSWGNIADGTSFTKTFKAGQILFGKRRAYLKKVAVADFDGLCSGDILVFDAIEKKILPELLPYLMQNDAFFEFAVKNSAGSLSPRTKWQDLVNFQFYLPDLKIQPKLVTLFKQIDDTIEQSRSHKEKLIAFKKGLLNELIG